MAPASDRQDAIASAVQQWNTGDQAAAVDQLRPLADAKDPVALGLIVWFLHQMPQPNPSAALDYADIALDQGNPWVINYVINIAMNDASLRPRLAGMIRKAVRNGSQVDPIGNAMTPFQQNDPATGVAMMEAAAGPFPRPESVTHFLDEIRSERDQVKETSETVREQRDNTLAAFSSAAQDVESARGRVQTRADQLETLMDQVTNAEAQTLFDTEATKNEQEGARLWKRGIAVLSLAAGIAVLPILIFYVAHLFGQDAFEDQNLVAAHFAPALALGAVAGVILARARGRDRAGQRARDLSVALGTMFAYSNQIRDETEREKFLRDMGRTVIESFLQADGAGEGDPSNLLAALTTRS